MKETVVGLIKAREGNRFNRPLGVLHEIDLGQGAALAPVE